jgi:hypothetical protein
MGYTKQQKKRVREVGKTKEGVREARSAFASSSESLTAARFPKMILEVIVTFSDEPVM